MSNYGPEGRSYERIERTDLERLLTIAQTDIDDFFARRSDWAALYRDRLLGFALCQGAANHYIGRGDGVQDFDVYAFFAEHPNRRWYAKRHVTRDFGDAKFGQSLSCPNFQGRRVDLLSRGLPVEPGTDLEEAIQHWLKAGSSTSAGLLGQKAVVLLSPHDCLGKVAWPLFGTMA
ncbi:MAG: hypothetical protein JSS14_23085 [Proteobacteria bacterium]|nr:hypothetical protein [Pseudomonadota bacterium]